MINSETKDIIIIGGGMVGLSLAYQLIERRITKSITILDKEKALGLHTSGRNSGVLHAGIYYKPGSLKAKVSVEGARRLCEWIEERNLAINKCGKVVIPTKANLDCQLDLLKERGELNGAKVELWDENQLKAFIPQAVSKSGRALWSPNTAVVKPLEIIKCLERELTSKGVTIKKGIKIINVNTKEKLITTFNKENLSYSYVFNCAGLGADRISKLFDVGNDYTIIPFKGIYWKLKHESSIKIPSNLYPVPDLSVPFLGVHFTPDTERVPSIYIGPTATPAWGRENYDGIKGLEPSVAISSIDLLSRQYINNKGGFRGYVHQQALQSFQPFFLKAAQELIPSIRFKDIEPCSKRGIRSQLFNKRSMKLEDDFLCINSDNSSHILNAVSPAFTASFALADLIIDSSILLN
ncbi:hypothetical protein EV11_0183 [Prochlorococcus sp. SS52]|uniref:FAD dependent oxidoreductase n=2 Tax=Prochlorococcaceae TaxID=2881426 RepID=Q7VAY4_PROMA|nr:FAD-dependent oxidoreductase [Prochlorococcus marinus]AAQ00363.1 FAD dependent oxidoreductase [Prochlorococcus marinus subsp. marinus str. CCMP1375]KGG14243.1 hypothetical protein EV04_0095 [Prochlorococcus marinus str. LG]KGG22185.1 hypothetical protein EV08_0360 [Prochlorococcus marinus str. SS2]KGG37308.1 hypothetical protein EV11_0183 [Prochlorococcus sp. SS52]